MCVSDFVRRKFSQNLNRNKFLYYKVIVRKHRSVKIQLFNVKHGFCFVFLFTNVEARVNA